MIAKKTQANGSGVRADSLTFVCVIDMFTTISCSPN